MSTGIHTAAGARSVEVTLVGVVGFAVAIAAASQVAIPIPGTPVPITLQPLLVLMAAFWLGPVAAAGSMMLYLTAGAMGLPVFTPMGAPGFARLLGPTGGYLLAYPVAAYVTGWLALRSRNVTARMIAALAGIAVIYAGGLSQLALITGSMESAVLLGVVPFAALDVMKAAVAAMIAPRRV